MRVVVPFAAREPKTRLAPVLAADERLAFARQLLADVLAAIRDSGHTPTVLSTAPIEVEAAVRVDQRRLTTAVNAVLDEHPDEPVAIVMADLPLVTADTLSELFEPAADVVLAPGRGGGTNAFVSRAAGFEVDYHGASIRDHRQIARDAGASVEEVDSFRLATDIDEPADLVEVLLHSEGAAADWLQEQGFELAVDDQERLGVERTAV
jgi:2-phospho-L-lactate guanylyltransferase